jgi:hypothetical protein
MEQLETPLQPRQHRPEIAAPRLLNAERRATRPVIVGWKKEPQAHGPTRPRGKIISTAANHF